MLGVMVFGIAFLLPLGITLTFFPGLPPGKIVLEGLAGYWTPPDANYSILGYTVSSQSLVISVINGVFWGIVFSVTFSLGRRASQKKVVVLPLSPSQPAPREPIVVKLPPQIKAYHPPPRTIPRVKKLDQEIEAIEGIGPVYGRRLRYSGITQVKHLLQAASTSTRRRDLADSIGVSYYTLLKWVSRADFFRIKGVGKQYSDLLQSAGIHTPTDLSRRNPEYLYHTLKQTNRKYRLVKRLPTLTMIQHWIQNAKNLEPLINYELTLTH